MERNSLSFQLHFLFIYWVSDGWSLSEYHCMPRMAPDTCTCWIAVSPHSSPEKYIQPHFHSRDEEAKGQRDVPRITGVLRLGFKPDLCTSNPTFFPTLEP